MRLSCSAESFLALAFPPKRPRATAAGFALRFIRAARYNTPVKFHPLTFPCRCLIYRSIPWALKRTRRPTGTLKGNSLVR